MKSTRFNKWAGALALVGLMAMGLSGRAEDNTGEEIEELRGQLGVVTAQMNDLKSVVSGLKVSGLIFGDAYWVAQSNNAAFQGVNGLQIRRVYMTLDDTINANWSAQARLEMNQADFAAASGVATPFLKTAFLKWTYVDGEAAILGLQLTPTFDVVESMWGYRFLEKTPLDLLGWAPSVDAGAGAQGKVMLVPGLNYEVVFANGFGQKSTPAANGETHRLYASLTYNPMDMLVMQVEGELTGKVANTEAYAYLTQAFVMIRNSMGRLGLQYAQRDAVPVNNAPMGRQEVVSAFLVANVTDSIAVVLRADQILGEAPLSLETSGGLSLAGGAAYIENVAANRTFALAGVDFKMNDHVHLSPNVEVISYETSPAATPIQDVIPRLTFYATF